MFWDHVAGVYDIFANFINRKTHRVLREKVSGLIDQEDDVLECALYSSVRVGPCL